MTPSLLDSDVHEEEADAEGNEAREIRQSVSEMPLPETMPASAGLQADELGYLWVERYRPPGDHVPVFDIFDREGTLVARATLPVDADILQIGEDDILALYRDDPGVEYLRLFSLTRSGES